MIDSIETLAEYINNSTKPGLVFRGHSAEKWELKPSLFRNTDGKKMDVESQIERFRKYLIGKVDGIEEYSRLDAWALGQHYELKTPLLDWTVSPGVAIFFALIGDSRELTFSPSVYCLNAEKINEYYCTELYSRIAKRFPEIANSIPKSIDIDGWRGRIIIERHQNQKIALDPAAIAYAKVVESLEGKVVRIFSPHRYFSGRVIGQRGLFSYVLNRSDLKQVLDSCKLGTYLEEIKIDAKLREPALKFLDAMNINHMTVFPDIMGAAHYSNMKLRYYPLNEKIESNTRYWL